LILSCGISAMRWSKACGLIELGGPSSSPDLIVCNVKQRRPACLGWGSLVWDHGPLRSSVAGSPMARSSMLSSYDSRRMGIFGV